MCNQQLMNIGGEIALSGNKEKTNIKKSREKRKRDPKGVHSETAKNIIFYIRA